MTFRLQWRRISRDISSPVGLVSSAVAIVAVLVRLPGVYTQAFWQDEVASVRILSEPTLVGMLSRVGRTESSPPLWYFLGWVLHHGGVPLRDVRLLSVAASGLLAVLVVVLARRFVSLPLAGLSGMLIALGGEYVGHGQELRAYALLALLSAVLAFCLLAELRAPCLRREIALALTVAAGGLTHFFFAFSVLAALTWLQVDRGARVIARRASLAVLGGCAVAAAWAPVMLRQYHRHGFWWIGSFQLRYVAAVPLRLFVYAYDNTPFGGLLSVCALAMIGFGCVQLARRSPEGRLVVALGLLPITFAAIVWAGGIQIFALRNLIAAGPFLAIAAAAALGRLPRRVGGFLAVALSSALAVALALPTTNAVPAFDAIARTLVHDGWRPSAPIAVFGSPFTYRAPLEWYLPRQPTLDVSRPLARVCRELFVVLPSGKVKLLRPNEPIGRERTLRRATILVDPAHRPSCLRLKSGGHIATVA